MYSIEIPVINRGTMTDPAGLWLINKPKGMSSFGVVARLRRAFGIKKIGHTGTLDPLASGLMLVLVGKEFTRLAQGLTKLDKVYTVKFKLGTISETDDEEGKKTPVSSRQPTLDEVEHAIASLSGTIQQVPPNYSAIKVGGQRAYKLARTGRDVELAPRTIEVYSWREVRYSYPYITAEVAVSSGTYIRALARDLGSLLRTGAYMTDLERTQVGGFHLRDAVTLDKFEKI